MLSARTIRKLDGIQTCARKGTHLVTNLFSIATNCEDLWLQAYANIQANKGSMTEGVSKATIDGFSMERVERLIAQLKAGTYRPKPSKRVFIPKSSGKRRPLGIPSADDKLVQEVWRILLEAVYEPVFVPQSHGFRPGKSCHTALLEIKRTWRAAKWFAEFDIRGCFENIRHDILVALLEKRIEDRKFINVIKAMLKAGYMQGWTYHNTYSGTPQGGIVSPILSNVFLHELDEFVLALPFNKGKRRARSKAYHNLESQRSRLKRTIKRLRAENQHEEAQRVFKTYRKLSQKQNEMTFGEARDPNFRRLWYCRYADDFLLGIIGSKAEAEAIKARVTAFIEEVLKLEISPEKTAIRHSKDGVIFLGYHVRVFSKSNVRKQVRQGSHCRMRNTTEVMALNVPKERVQQFCLKKGYGNLNEARIGRKIKHRPELQRLSDVEIVLSYNAELQGLANYYALAYGVKQALSHLTYVAHYSLYKTLANKHKSTVGKTIARLTMGDYQAVTCEVQGQVKEYRVFRLKDFQPTHRVQIDPDTQPNSARYRGFSEIVQRLQAQVCEYCGADEGGMEVHHIRRLKDIKDGKAAWQKLMIARHRKTLVLCVPCHRALHKGTLPDRRHLGQA